MTAPENKGPTVAAVAPLGLAFEQTDSSAPASFCGNHDDDHKAFASMAARAALCGAGLYRLADGELLLTRWGFTKTCPDLRSVAALLSRMTTGGQR